MKVKKGFELQEVCGEFIIVPAGIENVDFSKIISLNSTAADIWKGVSAMKEFCIDDMVKILLEQYEVDAGQLLRLFRGRVIAVSKDVRSHLVRAFGMEQYEVDEQTAREDCSKIAELWKEMGLTE